VATRVVVVGTNLLFIPTQAGMVTTLAVVMQAATNPLLND